MDTSETQDAKDFIQYRVNPSLNVPDTWTQLAIVHKYSREIVGDIGIYFLPNKQNEVKLGYTLSSEHQGRGYATEALTALIDYLKYDLAKTRFIALIAPENMPSIRLVMRLGFIQLDLEEETGSAKDELSNDIQFVLEV